MSGQELARVGDIIDVGDARDEQIDALERQVAKLRGELSDARHELTRVREDSNRALTALRQQLSPLYRALQRVFGELDDAGVAEATPETASTSAGASAPSGKWESWKGRLGPGCAKVIDTLLLGGEMTVTAIAVSARMGKRQVYIATSKMGQAGILVRNGSKFSLKSL